MKTQCRSRPLARSRAGFTVAEAVISCGVVALLVMACVTSIIFDQIACRKSKEEAIAMDFLNHYLENIKALPFASVMPGAPINSLYDGLNGAPHIIIPNDTSWVTLNTSDFQTFDPDLLWLNNRNPKLKVTFTQNTVGGVAHDIQINAKVDWDAPLSKGGRLEVQVDMLLTKDVTSL